jgi:hypothetical protein
VKRQCAAAAPKLPNKARGKEPPPFTVSDRALIFNLSDRSGRSVAAATVEIVATTRKNIAHRCKKPKKQR